MQQSEYGHKPIKNESTGAELFIPDLEEFTKKNNEIFRKENQHDDGVVSTDLLVKERGIFLKFNRQLQIDISHINKNLWAALKAVNNLVAKITPLTYDSIDVEINHSCIRFVMKYNDRHLTFEAELHHDYYRNNPNCKVILAIFERGKPSRKYDVEMDKIFEKISREIV